MLPPCYTSYFIITIAMGGIHITNPIHGNPVETILLAEWGFSPSPTSTPTRTFQNCIGVGGGNSEQRALGGEKG